MELPQLDPVRAAIDQLRQRLVPVDSEVVDISLQLSRLFGRVLSEPLTADRDSPPIDVSAMDGYAIRLADLVEGSTGPTFPVQGTQAAGCAPSELATGFAIRIFTGAAVPSGADCVVRREDTLEEEARVVIQTDAARFSSGQNIRYRGENKRHGETVLPAGQILDPLAISALASFGSREVSVRNKVRVSVLTTGDELRPAGLPLEPWEIRDSNGPTLEAWLCQQPFIEFVGRAHVRDRFEDLCGALDSRLNDSDAVILTGGVSMGDTDFVPQVIQAVGGQTAFHRLPIRPGKPVLGAAREGKLILGLPGNPVSVAVTARVIAQPLLLGLAGAAVAERTTWVHVVVPEDRQINLTWFRLVQIDAAGNVTWSASMGSGDLVSLAQSDGYVEVPPGQSGTGPFRLTLW